MAKKSFSKNIDLMMRQHQYASAESLIQVPKKETPVEEKRPVGRPRRKSSTSQNGLPIGETRMTFLIDVDQQEKLKYISFRERMSIKQIMSEAIQDYLNKYEEMYGEIDLNRI